MPGEEDRQEKTEKPTPKRLKEAREKGQVARSKELLSAAVLMAGVAIFYFFAQEMIRSLKEVMRDFIVESASLDLSQQGGYLLLKRTLLYLSRMMIPLLFFPLIGVAANVLQVGFLFTAEPLTPKFSRLNPVEGFKRLFSATAMVELIKGILKLLIIGYISYITIRGELNRVVLLANMEITGILTYLGSVSFRILLRTSWVLVILALFDYGFQRWETERNLKMSKQEVKEEFKETEGQPLIKSRIKNLRRQVAKRRMMQEVPKAMAIITNPYHLAIALKYEVGRTQAPLVVAKGAGLLAERIKEIAREHGVPLIENKPLAQVLYRTVDLGKEIPASLYKAVAEVLSYVYRLKAGR